MLRRGTMAVADHPDHFWMLLLTRLALRSPVLLAYLAGVVLALVWLRRYPRPALLLLLASAMLLAAVLTWPVADALLLRPGPDFDPARYGRIMTGVGFAVTVVHALAFGLLVAAALVGRRPPQPTAVRPAAPPVVEPAADPGEGRFRGERRA